MENCEFNESIKFGGFSKLINIFLYEQAKIGGFSKMAYSKMGAIPYIVDYTVVINSVIAKFTSSNFGCYNRS
jgi:hypothetical protein